MRRKDKEISDSDTLYKILKSAIVCRVAFFDEEYPYILPFNYGFANDSIYIHSALEGKKLDLIRKNNKISFVVEMPHKIITGLKSCDWTTQYQSVIGFGTITILDSYDDKKNALDAIMAQHGKLDENVYSESSLNRMLVLKINIDKLSGKQSGDY